MKKQKERVNPRNRLLFNVDNRDQRAIMRNVILCAGEKVYAHS